MLDKKISIFIDKQLSRYVRTNFEKYVSFIKKYFEFLESNYGPYHITQTLENSRNVTSKYNSGVINLKLSFPTSADESYFFTNYADSKDEIIQTNVNGVVVAKGYVVSYEKTDTTTASLNVVVTSGIFTQAVGNQLNFTDTTVTQIVYLNSGTLPTENPNLNKLIGELSPDYPKILTASKPLTIKGLADFVKSKGTEDSFRYFFRTVYNSDLEFYYPKKDMLKVSDGKWNLYSYITIKRNSDVSYLNKRIRGNTSGAIAYISRVKSIEYVIDGNKELFFELYVEDLTDNFEYNETISYYDDLDLITTTDVIVTVAGSPSLLREGVLDSGSSIYTIGDEITIDNSYVDIPSGKTLTNLIIRIADLDTDGKLKAYDLVDHGILNYNQTTSTGTFKAYIPPSVPFANAGAVQEVVINDGGLYPAGATITATISAPPSGTTAIVQSIITSLDSGTLITGVSISGTSGQFTCSNTSLAVNDVVKISGTFGGTGSIVGYTSETIYKVSSVTGSSPNVTGFTLTTESGTALTTTAGTPTGLTYLLSKKKVITGITLSNYGSGYKKTPTITFNSTLTPERSASATVYLNLAQIQFSPQTLANEPGQFANTDGFVSSDKYIQNEYYQDFSYVLKSEEDFSDYRGIVKDLLNPAGMTFFGIISLFNYYGLRKTNILDFLKKYCDEERKNNRKCEFYEDSLNSINNDNINNEDLDNYSSVLNRELFDISKYPIGFFPYKVLSFNIKEFLLKRYVNITTLSSNITSTTSTTINVTNRNNLNVNDIIQINNEKMLINVITGLTFTVSRGYLGTTAQLHSQGDVVELYDIPKNYRKIVVNTEQKVYGNTFRWIDFDRFNIPGFQGWENLQQVQSFSPITYYYPNQYNGTINENYYADDTYTFSNTPMKIVENTVINQFIKPNGLAERTNFNREAFITIKSI